MEFKVLKSGGLVKQFRSIIFTIGEDEFYYQKNKKKDKIQRYHISYLNEVYIQQQAKEKPEYVLILEINKKHINKKKDKKDKKIKIIKLAIKEDKNFTILSDIKKILNVKRLQYDMNLFLFNWKQKNSILINKEKLYESKDENQVINVKNLINENIEKKFDKEKLNELFQNKLNNFVKLLNQKNLDVNLLDEIPIRKIIELINGSFIIENNNEKIDEINSKQFKSIENFNKLYLNLIKLFTQIKFCYILKRYKLYDKKYLLESQQCNFVKNLNHTNENNIEIINQNQINIDKNSYISNDKNENNNNEEFDYNMRTYSEIIENENIKDIDSKITKKKNRNERIQSRIVTSLNSNSKMKENLKTLILSQNIKLYFCIRCNSLIRKTLIEKSNCNFDDTCTNRSFFYCKKCKLHLCTKCVSYQRGMKCSKNHNYFQKPVNTKEEIKCLICNKSNVFPYYECKYCKEQICSNCSVGITSRQISCFNCNNELNWRKCIYTSCDRCHKLSDCFYFCICCDYSICLNCSSLPKNICGGLHNLKEIDLMKDYFPANNNNIIQEGNNIFNKIYCYNYEILFNGKCSLCNATVGKKKIWSCLRCSFFLCEKCYKKNED